MKLALFKALNFVILLYRDLHQRAVRSIYRKGTLLRKVNIASNDISKLILQEKQEKDI